MQGTLNYIIITNTSYICAKNGNNMYINRRGYMKRNIPKTIAVTIILSLCLVLVPQSSAVECSLAYQAVNFNQAVISASNVNFRTGPATTFDIICKLQKGERVTVMGKLGDWYAVYYGKNGRVGAINKDYVKAAQNEVQNVSTKPATQNNTKSDSKNTQNSSGTNKTNSESAKNNTTINSQASTKQEIEKPVEGILPDEQSLLDMINSERTKKGLAALKFDADLVNVARLKAIDMDRNNYFKHDSPYYGTPFDMMKKEGVKFTMAGENIAGNTELSGALKAWMDESSNNLFNGKFTHTGIGIVDSTTYGKIFVVMFIKKG